MLTRVLIVISSFSAIAEDGLYVRSVGNKRPQTLVAQSSPVPSPSPQSSIPLPLLLVVFLHFPSAPPPPPPSSWSWGPGPRGPRGAGPGPGPGDPPTLPPPPIPPLPPPPPPASPPPLFQSPVLLLNRQSFSFPLPFSLPSPPPQSSSPSNPQSPISNLLTKTKVLITKCPIPIADTQVQRNENEWESSLLSIFPKFHLGQLRVSMSEKSR